MTAESEQRHPQPAFLAAGGVYLPGAVCEQLWRFLAAELRRHSRDGGRVRPELQESVLALRRAAQAWLMEQPEAPVSARGHDERTFADIAPEWTTSADVMTTQAAADHLGVTGRHLRRIARGEGIEPQARNTWRRNDIRTIARRRAS